MINVNEITTPYWQHKRNSIGDVVTDLDDIEQCYDTILNTIKGEIPFQPNIGCNIMEAIGQKPKEALEIARALILKEFSTQEPRADIISLTSSYDENGKIQIFVTFQSKLSNQERSTKYYV